MKKYVVFFYSFEVWNIKKDTSHGWYKNKFAIFLDLFTTFADTINQKEYFKNNKVPIIQLFY